MFFLLSLPRSGTRMLCDMLHSHPDVACEHEFFADMDRRKNVVDALNQLAAKYGKSMAVGHAQHAQVHPDMLLPDHKRIVLVRENLINAAVSWIAAQHRFPHLSYQMKPEYVEYNKYERRLHTAFLEPHADLRVTYEEITQDQDTQEMPEPLARRICEFLGVPFHPLTTKLHKNPRRLPTNMVELNGNNN